MTLQRLYPVLASIGIILVVALLRDKSRAAAAVLAVLPLNIPLAIWVVSAGANGDTQVMADFVRSIFIGLIPAFVWLAILFFTLRAGWQLWPAMALGYVAWGLLVAALFWFGILRLSA